MTGKQNYSLRGKGHLRETSNFPINKWMEFAGRWGWAEMCVDISDHPIHRCIQMDCSIPFWSQAWPRPVKTFEAAHLRTQAIDWPQLRLDWGVINSLFFVWNSSPCQTASGHLWDTGPENDIHLLSPHPWSAVFGGLHLLKREPHSATPPGCPFSRTSPTYY